jgi:dihydrofolate synthase/folylpolyglutamate synthase
MNRRYIGEEDCGRLIGQVAEAVSAMEQEGLKSPTAFEIETAVAFLYFREQKAQVMLVECGMGGRLDATNVFPETMINVLASVSLDHMAFLGDTVSEITREKLGIVKPGEILVNYPLCREAEQETQDFCNAMGVKRYQPDLDALHILEEKLEGTTFRYKNQEYRITIPGDYQVQNAITAISVMEAWNQVAESYGLRRVQQEQIQAGICKTVWPGRFSVLGQQPLFIADGAHNRDAWILLQRNLNKYFTKKEIVYIIGVLRDKEYDCMLDCLVPNMKCAFTVTPDSNRALDGNVLVERIKERGKEAVFVSCLEEAIQRAEEAAGPDGVVVACGTLTFIGAIIKWKGTKDEQG